MTTNHDPDDLDAKLAALLATAADPEPPEDSPAALFEHKAGDHEHHHGHIHVEIDVDVDADD